MNKTKPPTKNKKPTTKNKTTPKDIIENIITVKGHGPILITGSHTVTTIRRSEEIHTNEQYISKIINELYKLLGPKKCTIMTWNNDFIEKNRIYPEDPNHILNIDNSIWYSKLKEIKDKLNKESKKTNKSNKSNKTNTNNKIFHIDLHGMTDDWFKHDKHICIGTHSIKSFYPKRYRLIKAILIKNFNTLNVPITLNNPFNGHSTKKYPCKFYTLSHKGVLLGFFSIQLEISFSLRKNIAYNKSCLKKFKNVIEECYKNLNSLQKTELPHKTQKHKTQKHKTQKHKTQKHKIPKHKTH